MVFWRIYYNLCKGSWDAQGVEDILEEIQTIGEANEEDNEVESMHETNEAQGTNDDTSIIGTNGGNGRTDDVSSKKKKSSLMESSVTTRTQGHVTDTKGMGRHKITDSQSKTWEN